MILLPTSGFLLRKVAHVSCTDASIFYRYFNGHCSQEIRDIIPLLLRRVRTTRSSTHSHPFQVSLPTSRALSHRSSFIPRTCNFLERLAFLSPTTCHLSNLRSINLILSLYPLSCSLSSFFLCWGFV